MKVKDLIAVLSAQPKYLEVRIPHYDELGMFAYVPVVGCESAVGGYYKNEFSAECSDMPIFVINLF